MAQAMDIGDEATENTIPSIIKDSLESIQKSKELSSDDIAWVDSCLIKESDISDDNWNSLKAVLVEVLDLSSSSRVSNGLHGGTDIEIHPSSERTELERLSKTHNFSAIREELDASDDDIPINDDTPVVENAKDMQSFIFTGNPFLPGYNDELRVTGNPELEANVDSWVSDIEPSTEDIFRDWDLEVPTEEDDFIKQLNNALEEGLPQSLPSSFADLGLWSSKDNSIDDLIAGIQDLSLDQISS